MGSIRDRVYDSMWDIVFCEKHNWTGPDSRFPCPECKRERQITKDAQRVKAREVLKQYGLEDLV